MNISNNMKYKAAKLSENIYPDSKDTPKLDIQMLVFEHNKIPGNLCAGVHIDTEEQIAYVVFQGSIWGNWYFTNLQAFRTQFNWLDDRLADSSLDYEKVQGANCYIVLPGTVHQGFYQALSLLWYGTEPPLGLQKRNKKEAYRKILSHVILIIIFTLIPTILITLLTKISGPCALIIGLIFSHFIMIVIGMTERGIIEDLFRKPITKYTTNTLEKMLNDNLLKYPDINKVCFTGHSLGGAIAQLAFALYRKFPCSKQAFLITFGAPRIGDQKFVNAFSKINPLHYTNIVNVQDPVPELPPSFKIWKRGVLGLTFALVLTPIYKIYSLLYGQGSTGVWPYNSKLDHGNESKYRPLCFCFHKMEKYLDLLNPDK